MERKWLSWTFRCCRTHDAQEPCLNKHHAEREKVRAVLQSNSWAKSCIISLGFKHIKLPWCISCTVSRGGQVHASLQLYYMKFANGCLCMWIQLHGRKSTNMRLTGAKKSDSPLSLFLDVTLWDNTSVLMIKCTSGSCRDSSPSIAHLFLCNPVKACPVQAKGMQHLRLQSGSKTSQSFLHEWH